MPEIKPTILMSMQSNSHNLSAESHLHYHNQRKQHQYQQHQHHHDHHHPSENQAPSKPKMNTSVAASFGAKRSKKHWGTRERSGMSFLIVIAFFAVFGMIILTEVFMIDDRSHSTFMTVRHSNTYNSRISDSVPDYDNVKDDYEDETQLNKNKLGFVQFRDDRLKIQGADSNDLGPYTGILFNSGSSPFVGLPNENSANGNVPWGKVLSAEVEETLPRFPIGVEATDGSWQVVNGTRFKFFVFSAFYDRRGSARLVRVVGATKTRNPERVWCRFWYKNRNASEGGTQHDGCYSSVTVMAKTKIIRENWNLKYSACFILCPVRKPEIKVPHYVSVVARLRTPPGNLLDLRNTDWDKDFIVFHKKEQKPTIQNNSTLFGTSSGHSAASLSKTPSATTTPLSAALCKAAKLKAEIMRSNENSLPFNDQSANSMAVCVKPFHFYYDQSIYLIEYLEFYSILGVTHFTFYNHTIGPHANCVLRHYMNGDIPATYFFPNDTVTSKGLASTDQDTSSNKTDKKNSDQTEAGAQTKSEIGVTDYVQAGKIKKKATLITTGHSNKPRDHAQNQHQPPKSAAATFQKPTINILPWNLRMLSQKEIRTEGLFAALNDCLYRSMYRYKYVAMVDLDEFIIPRHTDSLTELIDSLTRRFRNKYTGAYSFQNAFFYLQFADDAAATQPLDNGGNTRIRAALVTQRKTKRRYKLHPQKQRSKYICRPEYVVEAGNHFVWEFSPGRGSLNVPPQEAILQHYRVSISNKNQQQKRHKII